MCEMPEPRSVIVLCSPNGLGPVRSAWVSFMFYVQPQLVLAQVEIPQSHIFPLPHGQAAHALGVGVDPFCLWHLNPTDLAHLCHTGARTGHPAHGYQSDLLQASGSAGIPEEPRLGSGRAFVKTTETKAHGCGLNWSPMLPCVQLRASFSPIARGGCNRWHRVRRLHRSL
jgi:hypothetical protein